MESIRNRYNRREPCFSIGWTLPIRLGKARSPIGMQPPRIAPWMRHLPARWPRTAPPGKNRRCPAATRNVVHCPSLLLHPHGSQELKPACRWVTEMAEYKDVFYIPGFAFSRIGEVRNRKSDDDTCQAPFINTVGAGQTLPETATQPFTAQREGADAGPFLVSHCATLFQFAVPICPGRSRIVPVYCRYVSGFISTRIIKGFPPSPTISPRPKACAR